MPSLNFGQLKRRVQILSGGVIDNLSAGIFLNQKATELFEAYAWSFTKAEALLATVASKSAGTVALTTPTTITGTGTSFVSADIGSNIKVAQDVAYYLITGVAGQVLTIETSYAGTSFTGSGYSVFKNIYTLASDFREMISPSFWGRLREMTAGQLDEVDPLRSQSDRPAAFVYRGKDANDVQQIEVWPVPSALVAIRYQYFKKLAEATQESTIFPIRADALTYAATADGLYAKIASDPQKYAGIMPVAEKREAQGLVSLREALDADLKIIGVPRGVRDYQQGQGWDDQFLSNHDTWSPG